MSTLTLFAAALNSLTDKTLGTCAKYHRHEEWLTSALWLNMVKRVFRKPTGKRLQRGVFKSVPELEQAVPQFTDTHNKAPAPFIWTKSGSNNLEKVQPSREKLNKLRSV